MSSSGRINEYLQRDLYVLEDENNPRGTKADQIYPKTVLDQVIDDLSPTQKTLRQIIEDLRQEILTGGRGNIVFPVTSVCGRTGDVRVSRVDLGLNKVDNTSDIDKPLSVPQRNALMEILANYDFNVDLSDLYNHIENNNNPHGVTLGQLDKDGEVEQFVQNLISRHNYSTSNIVHMDIRRSLARLWSFADTLNKGLDDRISSVLGTMGDHAEDPLAHLDLFNAKENLSNKVVSFYDDTNNNHSLYPSTRSVVEFITRKLVEFKDTLPNVTDWIDDITVVDTRDDLPIANRFQFRKAYFIRKGQNSFNEIAICRMNADNTTYSWDISHMGTYSKFNPDHFVDSIDGLSINMGTVVDSVLNADGELDNALSTTLSHYYTKDEIDDFTVKTIHMLPGTMDGTIRFYINGDRNTMSDDIEVAGLKRLAYLEYVTEEELFDQCIEERHIQPLSVATRHIQPCSVTVDKISCNYGFFLGNLSNTDGHAEEINLNTLSDLIRPLLADWPDPNSPSGNRWDSIISNHLIQSQLWPDDTEYDLMDKSYARRFRGTISVLPNQHIQTVLSTELKLDDYMIIDAGGTWMYQSDPKSYTILGGSNITGHTFATVTMDENGLYLESISIGDRFEAPYDIWVKYVKPAELNP